MKIRAGMVPTLVVLVALLLPLSALGAPSGAPLCFPETGQCIDGRFREYWEQNGGLPVFGYPISAAQDELNRDTGRTYLTQWFERNRFELHPENARPYDVLLGRLGEDRLLQQGRDWRAFPQADPSSPHYFPQTGQAIASEFWGYWSSYGLDLGDPDISDRESLGLFGMPLSPAQMETNSSGHTVLTQWFERARFEYHPNNADPYKVLLGLLGNEVRRHSNPQPTPTPLPPSYNSCQADPNADKAPHYPVRITSIDKQAEIVSLKNVSNEPVFLDGWIMCSIRGNQQHVGIGGVLRAGETRAFPHLGGSIWSDSDTDDGALYNSFGQLISYWRD